MNPNQTVKIGSEVLVQFEDGFRDFYTIVNSQSTDIAKGKISDECPLGKAILGQKPKEKITYFLNPAGKKINCLILKVNPPLRLKRHF